jgi:O-acetyl-ADP-ribose deacetylase (regulator of RNase III)
LDIAREKGLREIAFPAISCGVYRFPISKAVDIAISFVKEYVEKYNCFEKIIFIDLNPDVIQEYKKQLGIYG